MNLAKIHDRLYITTFWESRISNDHQHAENEETRRNQSALHKLRDEWLVRLEKRTKHLQKLNDNARKSKPSSEQQTTNQTKENNEEEHEEEREGEHEEEREGDHEEEREGEHEENEVEHEEEHEEHEEEHKEHEECEEEHVTESE